MTCLALALGVVGIGVQQAAPAVAAAPAAQQRDAAGNRMEALMEHAAPAGSESGPPVASPWLCTADRMWCLRTTREDGGGMVQLEVAEQVAGETEARMRYVPLDSEGGDGDEVPWPFIVRMASGVGAPQVPNDPEQGKLENVLVGALQHQRTSYSGGGASTGTLTVARILHEDDGIQIDTVATLPAGGHAMIRACFGEEDMKARAGACHDEYDFSAMLSLDPAGQDAPILRFQTTATRYPAGVSRFGDSLDKGPLTEKDLRREQDRTCSYQRTLHLAGSAYQPDVPLPDCSEFTGL